MNIAFVVPRFYPYRGGLENYVLKLTQQLHREGQNVWVLTSNAFDLESFWLPGFRTLPIGREDVGGVQIHRFPISYDKWIRRSSRFLGYLGDWKRKALYSSPGFCVKGLAPALRQLKADVVHIGPLPYTRLMYEGLREGLRSGARVIATPCVHFGEDNSREVASHYTRSFQMRLLNECHTVLTMTDMERDQLIGLGVDREKIYTTGLGVDLEDVTGGDPERFRTRYNVTGPIIFHLGTKAADKGTISVIEAMKILWHQGVPAWLVAAGSSTRAFDDYVRQHPGLPRLINLGPITESEKRDLLAAMDILAHPSRVESLGIVYLEAWLNRKPVIGADTAVSREIIDHGHDGVLIPFGKPEAIATAVKQLLEDPVQRQRMGKAGREKVLARYSWDKVWPKISQVLCGAVDSQGVSRQR